MIDYLFHFNNSVDSSVMPKWILSFLFGFRLLLVAKIKYLSIGFKKAGFQGFAYCFDALVYNPYHCFELINTFTILKKLINIGIILI